MINSVLMYPRRDLNPYVLADTGFKVLRVYQFHHQGEWTRAKNGIRTRDPNLGKVVLYQLSYFRIDGADEGTRTPTPHGTRS